MTADRFRSLALSLPETIEGAHFDVADFRVRNKIFATLRPSDGRAVVKLSPDEQRLIGETMPDVAAPVAGAWGAKGWTRIELSAADEPRLAHLLRLAWRNVAPKALLRD